MWCDVMWCDVMWCDVCMYVICTDEWIYLMMYADIIYIHMYIYICLNKEIMGRIKVSHDHCMDWYTMSAFQPELEILDPRTAELFPLLEAQAKETGDARIVNHSSFGKNFTKNKGLEEKLGSEMWKAEAVVVQKCSIKTFNLDQHVINTLASLARFFIFDTPISLETAQFFCLKIVQEVLREERRQSWREFDEAHGRCKFRPLFSVTWRVAVVSTLMLFTFLKFSEIAFTHYILAANLTSRSKTSLYTDLSFMTHLTLPTIEILEWQQAVWGRS